MAAPGFFGLAVFGAQDDELLLLQLLGSPAMVVI